MGLGPGDKNCTILITSLRIQHIASFIEYLKANWTLTLSVGIDLSSSNGAISDPNSYHYLTPDPEQMNQYEKVLTSVGKILEPYSQYKKHALYGFAATPQNQTKVSHCFYLNGKQDPTCKGFEEMRRVYRQKLTEIQLGSPTTFAPLLFTLREYCKTCLQFPVYNVMLIITNGEVEDMHLAKEEVVQLSKYPVSIIIVGVGDGDFTSMKELDADIKPIKSKDGIKAGRDLIQFVEFNSFSQDPIKLAEKVVEELPTQFIEYMAQNGISPTN